MRRHLLACALATAAAACSDRPADHPQRLPDPPRRPPNVLLIIWDTVRADRMSLYGHRRPTTPRLDLFAREALVCERAVSTGIWTLPSHATLFTGFPESAHGVNSDFLWLHSSFETLAEILQRAGYSTWLFAANPFVAEGCNLTQGFARVEHPWDDRWRDATEEHVHAKLLPGDVNAPALPKPGEPDAARPVAKGLYKECAPVAVEALLTWLDRRDGRAPFFAALNLMEAHVPRIPSREARRALMSEAEIEASLRLDHRSDRLLEHLFGVRRFDAAGLELLSKVYDACLLDLDAATGRLLAALEEGGLLDETLVILTSDHGENLGEHGLMDHKFCVYDTLVRVPLLLRLPSRLPPGRKQEPVSTLDLFATVLDLCGLEGAGGETPSRSFNAPDHPSLTAAPVFSEMLAVTPTAFDRIRRTQPDFDPTPWLRTFRAVDWNGLRWIGASDGAVEVYDLRRDPGETENLASVHGEFARSAQRALDHWLGSFQHFAERRLPRREAREFRAEDLKGLGYVGPSPPDRPPGGGR